LSKSVGQKTSLFASSFQEIAKIVIFGDMYIKNGNVAPGIAPNYPQIVEVHVSVLQFYFEKYV
jgi:hypothetical protein